MGHSRLLSAPGREPGRGDGRSESGVRVYRYEQPVGRNVQGMRQAEQCKHRNIALPQFDLADIGGPYARSRGECPMGKSPLLAVLTEGCSKTL